MRKCEATVFPIPPQPVLLMAQLKVWFPSFFSKLLLEIKESGDRAEDGSEWIKDVSEIISLNHLVTMGENIFKGKDLLWKLKLVSTIVLDHKGIDYTEFGLEVIKKFTRYPVKELRMMSQTKNPSSLRVCLKHLPKSNVQHQSKRKRKPNTAVTSAALRLTSSCHFKKHKTHVHKKKLPTCIYCIFRAKDLETLQSHSQSHNSTSVEGL